MQCDYCKEESKPSDPVYFEIMPLLGAVAIHTQCIKGFRQHVRNLLGLTAVERKT